MFHLYHTNTIAPSPAVRNRRQPKLLDRARSGHRVRHGSNSFATRLLMRTIREALGHKEVETTMISTHILGSSAGRGVTSPADTIHQPQVLL